MEVHEGVLKVVAVAMMDLEDNEVVALYMTALLGGNLQGKLGYEKITCLFEKDGTMHEETRRAFMLVAGDRVSKLNS